MLASNIPSKFPIPFAASAGSSDIRQIPTASQISVLPGAASLTDGFPPLNLTPIPAGGIPPFGQDMNGILNQITKWNQWHAAGGPVRYDAAFATSIGGYPSGALIESNSGHALYESLADNNTADPNAGGAQWTLIACVWSANPTRATGSANIQIVTLAPAPTSLAQLVGIPLRISSQGANTGPVTINPNGLGATPILWSGGSPLAQGVLTTGAPFSVVYDGFNFIMQTPSSVFTDTGSVSGATPALTIDGTNSSTGGNISLKGPGGVKFLRSLNNVLQWVNSAYTEIIMTLTDTGTLTAAAGLVGQTVVSLGNLSAAAQITGNNLVIAGTGSFGGAVSAPSFPVVSDYRAKISYGVAQDTGKIIDQVPVHDARMRSGGVRRAMFMAHEVAAMIPDAVHGTKDALNSDGGPALQHLDYAPLVPYLWAELQSVRKRLAELEGK